uniref:Uncharacterized protein n=1 Tax=Arion vulgaris TaxID=1028688 RepID=A0A0B7BAM0_9EUPU
MFFRQDHRMSTSDNFMVNVSKNCQPCQIVSSLSPGIPSIFTYVMVCFMISS